MHNHLKTGGWFSRINVNEVIDKARKRLGSGGVLGVVNFSPTRRYEDFASFPGYERQDFGNALYFPNQDIIVVKGEEMETILPSGEQVDLLALGMNKGQHPKPRRTLDDRLKEIKEMGGILGADHPFHKDGIGPFLEIHKGYLGKFDFLEVHNGECALWLPGYAKANEKALEFFNHVRTQNPALCNTLGKLVSSDGHSIYEIGRSNMSLPSISLRNRDSIVSSLRNGMVYAANENLPCKRHNSYDGAVDHIAKWVYLKVARKTKIFPTGCL